MAEITGLLSAVDGLLGTIIDLVKKLVIEVKRARNDVATLPAELENLQKQYKKLSDRVTKVEEANAKLQEVHAINPKLGEAKNIEGERLLERLKQSLKDDLPQLASLKKEGEEPRSKAVLPAFIGKGAAQVQKQIRKILKRLEDDCRDLDEAIDVDIFTGGARQEAGIARVEAGVRRLEDLLTERVSIIQDSQSSGTTLQSLPDYSVAMIERASALEETVNSLKDGEAVRIFGMGGIGKTTLAKQVFNNICGKFVYTCFVDDVKGIQSSRELKDEILKKLQQTGGKASSISWTDLTGKKTLIVLDDVDHQEQLASVLSRRGDFGRGSVIMFTTRNSHLWNKPYIVSFEVPFLDVNDARKLLCKHAFNEQDIPERLQAEISTYVKEVVKKCDGLPLSLEVIGSYLYGEDAEDAETWEGTIHKLSKAQGVDGARKDRLFATLQVSYDGLADEEQLMFCDIATSFVGDPLDVALAAMSTSGINPRLCWTNLVKRCLVKKKMRTIFPSRSDGLNSHLKSVSAIGDLIFEDQHVWMHEHLQDLGKRLAGNSFLSGRNAAADKIVEEINSYKEPGEIKHLRSVSCYHPSSKTVLQMSSLAKVTELKYLRLHDCPHQGPSQELPRDLALLQWKGNYGADFSSRLQDLKSLAVLEVRGDYEKFRGDCGKSSASPFQLPDRFGGLTQLKILKLGHFLYPVREELKELPESFGKLVSLEILVLTNVGVTHLPESFGNLCCIKTLVFDCCNELMHLRDSFGNLSSLRSLTIRGCSKLTRLPSSFSNLLGLCILDCPRTGLLEFKDAFQNFSMFQNLQVLQLILLNANVPPSFSQLSGSKTLQYLRLILRHENPESDSDNVSWDLSPLERLTSKGKELTALSQYWGRRVSGDKVDLQFELEKGSIGSSQQILEMTAIEFSRRQVVSSLLQEPELLRLPEVQTFPKCLGKFPLIAGQIEKLELCGNNQTEVRDSIVGHSLLNLKAIQARFSSNLKTPINSPVQLDSLKHLTISDCPKLETLPESLEQLASLNYLIIRKCGELLTLPESIGQAGSLRNLTIEDCPKLKTLPESLEQLGSLRKLTISKCGELLTVPEGIGQLGSLEGLTVSGCPKLKTLPESLEQLGSLEKLTISKCDELLTVPEGIGQLGSLRNLTIEDCPKLKTPLESLEQLDSLKKLTISHCGELLTLLEGIGQLGSLEDLTVSGCPKLKTLPESWEHLGSLKYLTIAKCGELLTLPEGIGQLGSLTNLTILRCGELLTLPKSIGQLGSLENLAIEDCLKLKTLPESLEQLGSLKKLTISHCGELLTLLEGTGQLGSLEELVILHRGELLTLPEDIWQLGSLKYLKIKDSPKVKTLPESLAQLGSFKGLSISHCGELLTLPKSIGQLGSLAQLGSFKGLSISHCGELLTLPKSIGQLGSLKYLRIKDCPKLKTLPESLEQLGSLENLIISKCGELLTLPKSIGQLGSLKNLTIEDCLKLKTLPESLEQLASLETLRICGCGELLNLSEGMGNLVCLRSAVFYYCPKLKAVPQSWGKVTSIPDQASASSSSPSRRPKLTLTVGNGNCPAFMDFVMKLQWDYGTKYGQETQFVRLE